MAQPVSPIPFPSRPPAKNLDFNAAGDLPFGGGGVYFVDPHLRTPYVYQYNLSVQREIMRDTTLEVSYIGSDSHKLTGLVDANPFLLGTKTRIFNAQPGVVVRFVQLSGPVRQRGQRQLQLDGPGYFKALLGYQVLR